MPKKWLSHSARTQKKLKPCERRRVNKNVPANESVPKINEDHYQNMPKIFFFLSYEVQEAHGVTEGE